MRPLFSCRRGAGLAALLAGLGMAGAGCPEPPKAPAPRPCCEQPPIPPGVTPFTVVFDEVIGRSDEQKVKLRVGLSQPIKREAVYPVLHTLYRHASKRGPFEPIDLAAEVYASDAEARTATPGKIIASISRAQSSQAPRCENNVRYDFAEQVTNAFDASRGRRIQEDPSDTCHIGGRKAIQRPDETFTHKPALKAHADRQVVEVTFPYLVTGKDEYVKDLGLNAAMRDWIQVVTSLFRGVEDLKEVTYTGLAGDAPVLVITLTRAQFDAGFAALQEEIAAHAAVTYQMLGMKKNADKKAEKEQETFKSKTYRAALKQLPASQVTVSPRLK